MSNKPFNVLASTEDLFLLKYLLIGLGCFAFFLWSTYDAFYAYPAMIPRGAAWKTILNDDTLSDDARQKKWASVSKENGWSSKRPTKKELPSSINQTIIWNYFFMAISIAIAAPCVYWYFNTKGSWIQGEDDRLKNSAGLEVPLKSITQIDKKKWAKKGIAVLTYTANHGGEETFVIDDLQYQRAQTDEIMAWVESNVNRDIIVNGPTEAETKLAKQKKKGTPTQKPKSDDEGTDQTADDNASA